MTPAVVSPKDSIPFILKSESVPSFSTKTLSFLVEQKFKPPIAVASLKAKVQDLEQLQATLIRAQEHPTRDKIVSLLAMAIGVAILACGILGSYYGFNPIPFVIPFVITFVISNFVTAFYNYHWSDGKDGVLNLPDALSIFVLPIVGPFIPVLQTFGNRARYQKSIEQTKRDIQQDFEEIKNFFVNNTSEFQTVVSLLDNAIQETQTNLSNLQKQTIKAKDAETSLSLQLQDIIQAKKYLEDAQKFFSET